MCPVCACQCVVFAHVCLCVHMLVCVSVCLCVSACLNVRVSVRENMFDSKVLCVSLKLRE